MILISSDTTYNLLKRTLAITIFFKGNLAGASSFSPVFLILQRWEKRSLLMAKSAGILHVPC